jgi:hypothetical protein
MMAGLKPGEEATLALTRGGRAFTLKEWPLAPLS